MPVSYSTWSGEGLAPGPSVGPTVNGTDGAVPSSPPTRCGTRTYSPAGRSRLNRPSAAVVTRATSDPSGRVTAMTAPPTGRGAQAESPGRSTGQTGPAVATPETLPASELDAATTGELDGGAAGALQAARPRSRATAAGRRRDRMPLGRMPLGRPDVPRCSGLWPGRRSSTPDEGSAERVEPAWPGPPERRAGATRHVAIRGDRRSARALAPANLAATRPSSHGPLRPRLTFGQGVGRTILR